ncbi:hypothetical protein WBG78_02885 [Chryseolinea sp. T2]|uniref:hypothetical protein n=1 Tax=Chryseolinea sp. T2 TaxID=3129255 RepID=UPI0030777CBC
MKKIFALLFVSLSFFVCAFGQHPLYGTWQMISIKGINANGEKFSADTSTIRETKVITPTHYMLIAEDVENDSLVFNRCYFGTIQLEGEKYIEMPILSSATIFENVKTDFTWKVVGDRFIQAGTVIRPDGKKVVLEELVFQRVKTATSYPKNAANGTWKLVKSSSVNVEGATREDTDKTVTAYQLITPTYWMYVISRDKKFEEAMGGSYSLKGDKYYPSLDVASFPKKFWGQTEMTQKLSGGKLHSTGVSKLADGKKFTWDDYFEKVK